MSSHVPAFETTLQKTHQWLRELVNDGVCHEQAQAYSILRTVLHALRDRLTPDEAVNLGAQLPMLVRGFYYEGWKPSATPTRQRTKKAFLHDTGAALREVGEADPERAVRCVFRVLNSHVSGGEVRDVSLMLPEDIRTLWPGRHASVGGL